MTTLELDTDRGAVRVAVRRLFNAGFTARDSEQVHAHVAELAELGVRPPKQVPTLYPLATHLAQQTSTVEVPHGRTSGEAEWALLIGDDVADPWLTVASDHTDRELEVHDIAASKQLAPNVIGRTAWRLSALDVDAMMLRAWVRHDGEETLIQGGGLDGLLSPAYWLDRLREHDWLESGTVLLGGTVAMDAGVDPFASAWRVELASADGATSTLAYSCERLPDPWN